VTPPPGPQEPRPPPNHILAAYLASGTLATPWRYALAALGTIGVAGAIVAWIRRPRRCTLHQKYRGSIVDLFSMPDEKRFHRVYRVVCRVRQRARTNLT